MRTVGLKGFNLVKLPPSMAFKAFLFCKVALYSKQLPMFPNNVFCLMSRTVVFLDSKATVNCPLRQITCLFSCVTHEMSSLAEENANIIWET